jgi:hypothetical protein
MPEAPLFPFSVTTTYLCTYIEFHKCNVEQEEPDAKVTTHLFSKVTIILINSNIDWLCLFMYFVKIKLFDMRSLHLVSFSQCCACELHPYCHMYL